MKQFSFKKFLSKNTKIIMTLVSVALMFVFALPTFRAPNKEGHDKAAAGHLDGVKVTNDDIAFSRGELSLLREMGFLPKGPTWIERFAGDDSQAAMYWYLLCTEASRYAKVGLSADEAVKEAANSLKRENPGYTEKDVRDLLFNRNINANTLAVVVSKLWMVYRYENFLSGMPQPVAGMELAADRDLRRVEVKYVRVEATEGWDKAADAVTAEQITAQFEAYKNVLPTPVRSAPDDAPVFLGLDRDAQGECALLGYPGAVDGALHLHEKEILPWDGSKLERIVRRGDFLGMGAGGAVVEAPYNALVLSGGGRASPVQIYQGLDVHGRMPSGLPAEVNSHRYPFGYKVPDRVKVEFLKFTFADLRKRMEPTATDVQTAFKVFQASPFKFRPQAEVPATASITVSPPTETAPASAPAVESQPASRSAKEIQKDWDDLKVREPYISEQVDLRCTKLLKNMVDAARSRAEGPWKGDSAPARANWISYQKITADLGKDAAYLGYQPEPGNTGADLLSERGLGLVPGIGRGLYTNTQGQMFDFPALATNLYDLVSPEVVKRLTESLKREPTKEEIQREIRRAPLGRLNVALGQEPPADVMDRDGNMYLFRAVECQGAHVPASLDEKTAGGRTVRDDVLADCRKLAAFHAQIKAAQAAVVGGDLAALAAKYNVKVQSPPTFNSDPDRAPVDLQYIRDFVKTAFTLPEPAEGKPASVTVLANDELLKAYAMKLERILPTSGLDFAAERVFLYRQPDMEVIKFVQNYMSIENVAKRLKFVPAISFTRRSES